jgi:biopolymer transport protein ExbB
MRELLWQALDYLEQGGWIMIPMAVTCVVMWSLILERLFTFAGYTRRDISVAKAMRLLEGENVELWSKGLRVQLVGSFLKERSGNPEIDQRILRQCSERLRRDLTRYLAIIAVLAAVAPLMGLLGTVLGMIETFDVISLFGTGNARAMAGGISVALVTTQTGLLVAIPGLFLSGLLMRRSTRLEIRLDEVTSILERVIGRPDGLRGGLA